MPANMKLRILDCNGVALYDGPLIRLALKDEAVKAKSMEFFRDPEPCMIHRSAVMSRLYGELLDYFCECGAKGKYSVMLDEMPVWLLWYLALPVGSAAVEL